MGMISGTSLDGIDAALVDVEARDGTLAVSLLRSMEEPWPSELRDRISRWSDPAATVAPGHLSTASMAIGELFADVARGAAEAAGVPLGSIDLVASHGQTIHHHVDAGGRALATLQIGEPAVIAERTGRTVVADFRPRDIAAGGQGAPLVSFVDALMLGEDGRTVAALNLGGMANVTVIPAGAPFEAIAFDTGPGNSLIDGAARHLLGEPLDRDGEAAAAGRPCQELVDELLDDAYFRRPPPKSTGRELFGDAAVERLLMSGRARRLSDSDILATATELTARSVAGAIARWSPAWPAVVHLSGGGTRNATLMRALERALERETPRGALPMQVQTVDETGLPAAAKEAVCFAVLGHEALHGRPNSLPGCTGARHASVLGAIWPGANYPELLARVSSPKETPQRIDRIVLSRSGEQERRGVLA